MQVIGARLAPITHEGKAHTQEDQTVHQVHETKHPFKRIKLTRVKD